MTGRFRLVCLLAVCLNGGTCPSQAQQPAPGKPFSDVPPSHWAAASVEKLRRAGIVVGYPTKNAVKPASAKLPTAPKRK